MKNEFKNKLQTVLELPSEMLGDTYRITAIGNESIIIENYKSIIEYESYIVRVSCGVSVLGDKLNVLEISSDEIVIGGIIQNLEFEK
jgi:sporulation protein YqfC